MKRKLLAGVCVVMFGVSGMAYSDDTTVTLDGNTSGSGFSIKDSSGTSIARFQGDGKVGIGTTNPAQLLHLSSSSRTALQITANSTDWLIDHRGTYDSGSNALSFTYSGSERMRIDSSGNVGIGTTAPEYTMHVAGPVGIGTDQNLNFVTSSGAANVGIRWSNPTNGGMGIDYMGDTGRDQISVVDWNAPAERVVFYRNGNVSVGGNLTCVSLSQTSSRDVKKDISAISANEAMEALSVLDPVKFKYKTDATNEEHLGFIAEDVPDLVSIQGHKALSPMDITAVLTKVVQEQQKQIEELKEMMNKAIQLASVK